MHASSRRKMGPSEAYRRLKERQDYLIHRLEVNPENTSKPFMLDEIEALDIALRAVEAVKMANLRKQEKLS